MNSFRYYTHILLEEWRAIRDSIVEQKLLTMLLLAMFIGLIIYLKPFPQTRLVIATGGAGSTYMIETQNMVGYFKDKGIEVIMRETSGSLENAELLNDPDSGVDVAFIQGGVINGKDYPLINSLGSIQYEPVWIFFRDQAVSSPPANIKGLAQLRVGVGPQKGGTQAMMRRILALNGIAMDDAEHFIIDSYKNNLRDFLAGSLDAVVLVTTYTDPDVQLLLHQPGISLFEFRHAEAYDKQLSYIDVLTLPESSVDIRLDIPPKDITLIGTTTQIAVKKNMHPDLQTLLLIAAKDELRSAHLFFSSRNSFPAYVDPTIPASPAAITFYENGTSLTMRYLPYWALGLADRLWALLLPLLAFLYPLSKLHAFASRHRYDLKQHDLYHELLDLERELLDQTVKDHDRYALLQKIKVLNRKAIKMGVPFGMEKPYFQILSAITLLRRKIEELP